MKVMHKHRILSSQTHAIYAKLSQGLNTQKVYKTNQFAYFWNPTLFLAKFVKGKKHIYLSLKVQYYWKRLTATRAKRLFGKLSLRSTFLMSFEPYVNESVYALNWMVWMDKKVNAEQNGEKNIFAAWINIW